MIYTSLMNRLKASLMGKFWLNVQIHIALSIDDLVFTTLIITYLIQRGLNKMADIVKKTLSNAFQW